MNLSSPSNTLSLKGLLLMVLASFALLPVSQATDVRLVWDPSSDDWIANYQVYYGTNSGSYTVVTNAGLATELTVLNLTPGTTYYFAATAMGTNDMESEFSNEISYTVPLDINAAPTITLIDDQTIDEDGVAGPIMFTVGDAETGAAALLLSANSSNPGLLPETNILFGGFGSNRTVTLTPVANTSGGAQVTVAVSDGELMATRQFLLTVKPVNDWPTISAVGNQTISEDGVAGPLNITVGDLESPPSSLLMTASSSNPTLLPETNIVFGGSGANRTVTLTPQPNASGTSQVRLSVDDGTDVVTRSFTLTVLAVDDAPTLTSISNQTINQDTETGPIRFTVDDVDDAAGSLVLTAASSNPALVPSANIVFGGSGADRTVTVTPASKQTGSAEITVTVSDGTLSASQAFALTVKVVKRAPAPPGRLRLGQ